MKLPVIMALVLLLSGGTAPAYAQQKIDSLEKVLKQELPDTTQVKALLQLSYAYEYVDVVKSRDLTQKAIKIIDEKGLTEFKGRAYSSMGSIFRVRGDYRAALNADNTALESTVLLKDSAYLGNCFTNVGYDYYDLGEYDEAYHYFTQAYKVSQSRQDSVWMAIALHNIGRVFKSIGQYDRALDYIISARKLSLKVNGEMGEPHSLGEIGDVMLRKGQYDSAFVYLLRALAKSKEHNLHGLQPSNMTNIAKVFVKKQDLKTALSYYDSAYILYSRNNDRYGIAEVKLGQGHVQLAMGNYNASLDAIQRSLELARQQNANVLEIQCYQQLSTLWELKGDYKKSLAYFKEFKQLEDTLFSQDMQGKLVRDQLRFETESKDSQIAVLSKQQAEQEDEIKRQEFVTNILVVVMALSVIVLITVYRSGQRRRKINMLLLKHQEETEKRSEELERLNQVKDKFFSIISHDLRSPINALAGMLDLMDKGAVTAEELPVHVKELRVRFNHTRTLLNNLLDWTLLQMDKLNLQPGKIDLHKMVDENILLLGPVQGKDIHILNQIPESTISFADLNTVNLVIRNLITNAIKFTNDGGEVIIRSEDKGNEWLVSVRDNGVGIKPEVMDILFDKTAPYTTRGTANEKGTGLGLILCKEFIEKNGGKIGVESKEGDGSTFFFTLPKAQ